MISGQLIIKLLHNQLNNYLKFPKWNRKKYNLIIIIYLRKNKLINNLKTDLHCWLKKNIF